MTDEARLRSLLGRIGDRTPPAAPFDEVAWRDLPLHGEERSRWGRVAAAVAVAAGALIMAILAVDRRGDGSADSPVTGDRWIAIPLWVPSGMRLTQGSSAGDSVEVAYASGSAELTVLSRAPSLADVGGVPAGTLSSGASLFELAIDGAPAMAWSSPGGGQVVLRWSGLTRDDVVLVAESIWFVDVEAAEAIGRRDGFVSAKEDSLRETGGGSQAIRTRPPRCGLSAAFRPASTFRWPSALEALRHLASAGSM